MTPMEKRAVIDTHFSAVIDRLVEYLQGEETSLELWDVARARHILGHYEYGDANLFEWSDGKVRAAIIEELADAVVYQAWLEERAERRRK